MKRKKVLLIGATGNVGKGFIEDYIKNNSYQKEYELILTIHRKSTTYYNFKTRKIDIGNISNLKKNMKDIDVVINLAANPNPKSKFNDLLEPNIIGAYNVFQAASAAEVKRVIFASSVHAIKGYGKDYLAKHTDPPKPLTIYGATKSFGESLCNVYSSNYNISCIAIRIGAYISHEIKNLCFDREDYEHVVTQKDLSQLIHKTIIASDKIKFAILSGVSNNKKLDMDIELAKKLVGYEPEDDAYEICEKLKD